MDIRAIIKDSRSYIPARFVGYALGYEIKWQEPNVYYTFVNKQTTDFQLNPNSKFPNKFKPFKNKAVVYSYYDGYGDVNVINGDEGNYFNGYKSTDDILEQGAEKNTLLLLHTFLGDTGERIWQMMSDYLTNSGLQNMSEEVIVPNGNWAKPPIDEKITKLYGLQFVSNVEVTNRGYFTTIYDKNTNKNITISYLPVVIAFARPEYAILW